MTVDELIAWLEYEKLYHGLNGDATVIVEKDSEGNAYSPLAAAYRGWYVPESSWSGTCYADEETITLDQLNQRDAKTRAAYENAFEDGTMYLVSDDDKPVVVLGPVN